MLIFGTTDLAKLAHYHLTELGETVVGFVVDEAYRTQTEFLSLPVLNWEQAQQDFPAVRTRMFVAVGYKHMRQRAAVYERVKKAGYSLVNIVSPSSHVAQDVTMGDNNFIMPGVVVEPSARLGNNNVVWSNATLCHSATVGDHNFIAAGAVLGGHASLGDLNFIGFRTTVLQHIAIGRETVIGAHALVNAPTRDLQRYWGTPAKAQGAMDAAAGIQID